MLLVGWIAVALAGLIVIDHVRGRASENRRRHARTQRFELLKDGLFCLLVAALLAAFAAPLDGQMAAVASTSITVACLALVVFGSGRRRVHRLHALSVGAIAALLLPDSLTWFSEPHLGLTWRYGMATLGDASNTTFVALAAAPLVYLGLRDLAAVFRLLRPQSWRLKPIKIGARPSGRTVLIGGLDTHPLTEPLCRAHLAKGDSVLVWNGDDEWVADRFGDNVGSVRALHSLASDERIDAIILLPYPSASAALWPATRAGVLRTERIAMRQLASFLRRAKTKPECIVIGSSASALSNNCAAHISAPWRAIELALAEIQRADSNSEVRIVTLRFGTLLGKTALNSHSSDRGRFHHAMCWLFANTDRAWTHSSDALTALDYVLNAPHLRGEVMAAVNAPVPYRQVLSAAHPSSITERVLGVMVDALDHKISKPSNDSASTTTLSRLAPSPYAEVIALFEYTTAADLSVDARAQHNEWLIAAAKDNTLAVYYNGACPMCEAEMMRYRQIQRVTPLGLRFIDINRLPQALRDQGLNFHALESRMYVVDAAGKITGGADAVGMIWSRIPALRWLGRALQMPLISATARFFYDLVVAPIVVLWARHRRAKLLRAATLHRPQSHR
jgi:predicted DCC family thiol-disulfide oxidoreductase YuxK/NAD dependent epimerase/dehydratase family enzyme